jgi:hypothetical protein
MAAIGAWFVGGLYLDAWAHSHIRNLETFFTPWHGVLYSSFAAIAGYVGAALIRNQASGYPWRRAMPEGYGLSLIGVTIFLIGGLGDLAWHTVFGIEVSVEAAVSPSHMALAIGFGLIVAGPLRAAWSRAGAPRGAAGWLPALLSLTYLLSIFTSFTYYAHPAVDSWAALRPAGAVPSALYAPGVPVFFGQALGVAAILIQTAILMGLLLPALRRWRLPFGAVTLVLTLNIALMSVIRDQQRLIPAALAAGLIADLMILWLRPGPEKRPAFRVVAFAVPALFYALYFVSLLVTGGIAWSVHLWLGATALAGMVGLLLSWLVLPAEGATAGSRMG